MRALLKTTCFAVALLALGGCTVSADASDMADTAGGPGTGGSGGAGGGQALTIAFDVDEEPFLVDPSVPSELRVTVSPADPPQTVRFALVDGPGGAVADASLDRTKDETDANGVASVWLTPPSMPTTFDVRALVGTYQDTLTIAVNA